MSAQEEVTNRERILRTLRLSSSALDDDQLAQRVGITPRQTVNQICRRLSADGIVDRVTGPDGKIVNVLISSPEIPQPPAATPVVDAADAALPAGHSREQREAERHM